MARLGLCGAAGLRAPSASLCQAAVTLWLWLNCGWGLGLLSLLWIKALLCGQWRSLAVARGKLRPGRYFCPWSHSPWIVAAAGAGKGTSAGVSADGSGPSFQIGWPPSALPSQDPSAGAGETLPTQAWLRRSLQADPNLTTSTRGQTCIMCPISSFPGLEVSPGLWL